MAALEYPPYNSQHLPDGTRTVALPHCTFAIRSHPAQIDCLPWARVRAHLHDANDQGALAL